LRANYNMEVKDWARIESLFHDALRLEAAARAEYLNRTCLDDESVRAEVESLLAAFEGRDGFLEKSAFSMGIQVISGDQTGIPAGEQIGLYKILQQLGRGGMGDVYLAEDTRLGRKVALKFLSRKVMDDNWAKRQLVKEAQAAAMLDHPNICAIHGLEEVGEHTFIAMQYVEGDTLSELVRNRLPNLEQGVSLATQIVAAVAEAHAHGIIHRDIKPQNIMVTAAGQVKVLDFGLAKIIQHQQQVGVADDSGRISTSGLVVGTVAYMSPEQLRAERLDYRSDVFSVGVVLYELFSGHRPFVRDSDAELISAILTSQPPSLAHPSDDIPPALTHIILKCLQKDKEQRFQSASEVLYELSNLQQSREMLPTWRRTWLTRTAVYLLLLTLLISVVAFAYKRLTRVPTLAVLPIVNASGDLGMEPLSDGLTEDLINRLSRLSGIRVKTYTLVSGYKGQKVSPQEVGQSLGVDAVLTATVVSQGETLELQTILIDTSDGTQLWGERYAVRPEGFLELQEKVSEDVVASLLPSVGRREREILTKRRTNNPEALREYYAGRNLWEIRSKENILEIIAHYEKAIELDASYAEPYAGLANCYALSTVAYLNMPPDEALKKGRFRAEQALELDDRLPEARTALGIVKLKYGWDWDGSEAEFKRAIASKPDYAWAHYYYAELLTVIGRTEEAIVESRKARDLAPFSPVASMNACRSFYFARRYDESENCFQELLVKTPGHKNSRYLLGYVYMQQQKYAEAINVLQELYQEDKVLAAAPLGFAYGRVGMKSEAVRVLTELREEALLELKKGRHVPPHEEAIIYIGMGETDEAFARLEKSYNEHFISLIYLTADPVYDSLRSDPRFADLARRLKLLASVGPAEMQRRSALRETAHFAAAASNSSDAVSGLESRNGSALRSSETTSSTRGGILRLSFPIGRGSAGSGTLPVSSR
jgi:serine/threonine protein kinase